MIKTVEKKYITRIADSKIERYLKTFGAVEVSGTKWCGKTWSSIKHGASVSYVEAELELAQSDPKMMLLGERPHVIDEWQRVPEIWDATRREVDFSGCEPGQFILTGSATPLVDANTTPSHSGAGRFGRIRMFPMSLFESSDSTGEVSLKELFQGDFQPCKVESDAKQLADLVVRGGWPAIVSRKIGDASLIAKEYIDYTCARSLPKIELEEDVARRLMGSLARNVAQSATYKTIISDMYGKDVEQGDLPLTEKTLSRYLSALTGMYVIEEIAGWTPQVRSKQRVLTKPKRYFADPSLACAFLNMSAENLLSDFQTFGLMFENMVMRDLMVYSQELFHFGDHPIKYYHDDSGLECDAIIELADGKWAGIEIKISKEKVEDACKSLNRLKKKLCKNPKGQTKPPEFLAVIIGVGEYAYQTKDGIYVIPIKALGP